MIKEDFLHYLWKLKKFDLSNLISSGGQKLIIIDFGTYNTDSGPDFFNAKVQIDDTIWAGNIEMHVRSSDWIKHNHQTDKAYNNVILHVVYEDDLSISTQYNVKIPTLELKNRIFKNDLKNYKLLRFNKDWVSCQKLFKNSSKFSRIRAVEKALTDRLMTKSSRLKNIFTNKDNDWNDAFFVYLARYFGMKVNADAFEMLAGTLPYKTILKEKDELIKIEALLFGQSGLLEEEFEDDYPQRLKQEYEHLKIKYSLSPIPVSIWKFSKLRPANFPTIRIAQLAKLLFENAGIFSSIIKEEDINNIKRLFKVKVSGYWLNHYIFDEESTHRQKSLGKSAIDVLMINTVVPTVFLYGLLENNEEYKQKAVDYLSEIAPESNSIINKWSDLGFSVSSAYDTQALLELKQNYCSKYRCLDCPIGNDLMNK